MPWEGTYCKSIVCSFLVGHLPFPKNSNEVRYIGKAISAWLTSFPSRTNLPSRDGTQTYRVRTDRLATCNNRILTHPADHVQAHPNSLSGAQTSDELLPSAAWMPAFWAWCVLCASDYLGISA